MENNKNKSAKQKLTDAGFTLKGLRILLAFSFVATILAFCVAYSEHRQYTELVSRYDDAMVRISQCEESVEALSNNVTLPEAITQTTAVTTTVTTSQVTESTSFSYAEQTTTQKHKETTVPQATVPSQTTAQKETSSVYYVTQSGKKYHVASCSYLSKSKIAITMDRIKAEGYSPCSRCIK